MIDLVTLRPRARLDLLEQFAYFGEQASVEVAGKYFAAVEGTCALVVTQPRSGSLYDSGAERLAGLRRVPVKGFDNYLQNS
jgi:plasmid stabilization system protein ParE